MVVVKLNGNPRQETRKVSHAMGKGIEEIGYVFGLNLVGGSSYIFWSPYLHVGKKGGGSGWLVSS